ncbi:MAG: NAD-dependent deacylase [Candidatus Eisenbacteria bacterium]|nr:NAD-dependent deacylase [Candidatus Eisenbacteria bacterium]
MTTTTRDEAFRRARALLREASEIVAFTGAGISAESGIPTYRDAADGLWQKYDPSEYANIDRFLRDSSLFWRFFQDVRYRAIKDARPNAAHEALAALERAGKMKGVVTQNIDGLHQAAGSREVVELHGNTRRIRCLDCGKRYGMDEVYEWLRETLPPPCPDCRGRLKPDVVFFGEALPEDAFARAVAWIDRCDLLLAVGSSLAVYPAALLPTRAKARGARLIVINKTPTPADSDADAVLREAAGEVLPQLIAAMPPAGE